jgi:hypothetical protein
MSSDVTDALGVTLVAAASKRLPDESAQGGASAPPGAPIDGVDTA